MDKKRVHAKTKSAEQVAEEKKLREAFQRTKPSLEDLVASGDYEPPISQAVYFSILEFLASLKRARESAGLSLADVSAKTGIDRAAISRLENGVSDNPTLATLERYASAVGKRLSLSLTDDPGTVAGSR